MHTKKKFRRILLVILGANPAMCNKGQRQSYMKALILLAVLGCPCSQQILHNLDIHRPLSQSAIPASWQAFLQVLPHEFRRNLRLPCALLPEMATVPPIFADFMKYPRGITISHWNNHARVVLKNHGRVYIINPCATQHCRGNYFTETFPHISKRWPNHTFTYVGRKLMRANSRDCSCAFQCIAILLMYFVLGESGALTAPIPPTVYAFITRKLGSYFPPPLRS